MQCFACTLLFANKLTLCVLTASQLSNTELLLYYALYSTLDYAVLSAASKIFRHALRFNNFVARFVPVSLILPPVIFLP